VHHAKSTAAIERPKAYFVPASRPDIIERLKLHGVKLELLQEPRTVSVGLCRLIEPKPASQPTEGHHRLNIGGLQWEQANETFPAGSVRVPTDQPLGDLAIALLDAESDDSFLAWGFFPEILQRTEYIEGYAVAPLAEQMLAADPKLKTEFELKLTSDPAFAKDPEARLRWFYEKSPFYDQRHLLYPVGVER
jgi:hypothetical protein